MICQLQAALRASPLSLTVLLGFQQPIRLPLLHFLRKIRSRDLASLHRPRIRDSTEPAHRPQHPRINNIPILVDRILPYPESHPFDNRQHARLLARRHPALKLGRRKQFPFDAEDGLLDARRLDVSARRGREAGQRPLRCAIGCVDAGGVGGFDVVFADDVYGAFLGGLEVAQRIFGVGEAACEADGEERGVVVDDVGVGEGGKIGGGA